MSEIVVGSPVRILRDDTPFYYAGSGGRQGRGFFVLAGGVVVEIKRSWLTGEWLHVRIAAFPNGYDHPIYIRNTVLKLRRADVELISEAEIERFRAALAEQASRKEESNAMPFDTTIRTERVEIVKLELKITLKDGQVRQGERQVHTSVYNLELMPARDELVSLFDSLLGYPVRVDFVREAERQRAERKGGASSDSEPPKPP